MKHGLKQRSKASLEQNSIACFVFRLGLEANTQHETGITVTTYLEEHSYG